MSLTRKVAYNTIVQMVGKFITTLISISLVVALTRYLGVSGYGQYTTIFAYTQFFAVLADFGFFWFLVRELAKPGIDENRITNNVLTFRALIALGFFFMSFLIGFLIPQYQDIRWGIGIIAIASFWTTLNSTYVGIFQSNLRMDKAAISDILGRLAVFGIVLYQIKIQAGLDGILWSYFVGNFINFAISAYLGRHYFNFRFAFEFKLWKEIFWQCLPISIVSILGLIYFKVDTIMLSLLKTPVDVGIYGPPYKVVEILLLVPAIFMGNVFPIISRYIHEKNANLEIAFQKAFEFLMILALPIIVATIFTASRIIEIVGGVEYITAHTISPIFGFASTSSLVLQILIIAVGISFMSHLFGYTVIALGKQTKMIWPNLILVVFNIALNLILIPKISYIGAAVVTVLTEFLVVYFYWKIMRRYFKIKIKFGIVWKVVLSSAILGLVLKYFSFLSLWWLFPLAIIAYLISLNLVKGISKETIKEVIKLK